MYNQNRNIRNRYTFLRRLKNRLHDVSPFFYFIKKISQPFKIMRLKKKIAQIRLSSSPLENDPIFTSVEIETINRCNGNCSFCPVNHRHDTRQFKKMSKELFYKIINDLASVNFDHTVCLYSNNEPLLDNRIYEFAEYAKSKLCSAP